MFAACCCCTAHATSQHIAYSTTDEMNGKVNAAAACSVVTPRQVNAFLKRAVQGCPCTYFADGKRVKTKYYIDQQLENLFVAASIDNSAPVVTCPLAAIQDIYLVDDGAGCIPAEVLSALQPAERELFYMVVFADRGERTARFCVLDSSRSSRDICLESLKILSIGALISPPGSKPA
mmetsp:Transcript_17124/g.48711  ORF Transcript_17124/g.48711 Transcript_17124/m.48711 type:complete len:177 (+) Transcript_17124:87-617(+)